MPALSVEVVLPWRGGCEHRARALAYVQRLYAERHAHWTVTLAEAPPGEWSKALAVNPAVERSRAGTVIVADADVWCDGLAEAVAEVGHGAPWVIPHRLVHRLSQQGTQYVLAGEPWQAQETCERPYRGVQGGGFVIAPREILLSVPLDARFSGWGQEDESWAISLWSILGPAWRGEADLYHLFHPPQQRWTRRRGSRENWRLRMRYSRAKHDPRLTRLLIEEGRRGCHAVDQQAVHPHP